MDAGCRPSDPQTSMHDPSLDASRIVSKEECTARPSQGMAALDDRALVSRFAIDPRPRRVAPCASPLTATKASGANTP